MPFPAVRVLCASVFLFVGVHPLTAANFGLAPGDIVVSEFFEDLFKIDPQSGAKLKLFPSPSINTGDHVAIGGANIFVSEGSKIWKINSSTGAATVLVPAISGLEDMEVEPGGTLLAVAGDAVIRIDTTTGAFSTLVDKSFFGNNPNFGPTGLAVTPTGGIVVTDFFEEFYGIDPVSGFATRLPLAGNANVSVPSDIEYHPGGYFIYRDFSDELRTYDPTTGIVTLFSDNLPNGVVDFAIEADGDVILTSSGGVYHFDGSSGARTLLSGGSFFSPKGIDIVTVPEVSSVLFVGLCGALCVVGARRRYRQVS